MITPTLEELRQRIGCPLVYLPAPREPRRARLVRIGRPPASGRAPTAIIEVDAEGGPWEIEVSISYLRLTGGY